MATTLTIGGSSVNLIRTVALDRLLAFSRGGIPSLMFHVRGGALPGLPDPYLGKEAVLEIGGTVYFKGDVVTLRPGYREGLGWVRTYTCVGMIRRLYRVPHTDANTGTDSSAYNLSVEDVGSYNAARAGRTVGEILDDVLSGADNAAALAAAGVTIGAGTTADLAALATIPPAPVYVQGEKLLSALEGFLSNWAPNHMLHVQPADGQIRFLDTRTFSAHTFTLGTDPVEPSELSRDISDCFSRLLVRGAPIAVMALLKQTESTMGEAFDHDGLSNSAAKTAWKPSDWRNPATGAGQSQDVGDCTCASTTTISITNSRSTVAYATNYWDQTVTGRHGSITLASTTVTGITQFWTARVVSSTAQSAAGGSFSVTIDVAAPHTNFDKYTLNGLASLGPNRVWTRYRILNTAIIPRLTSQSTHAQPFINGGGGVSLTSEPMGAVLWPISGTTAPFNTFPLPFTYAAGDAYINFALPTYLAAGGRTPADVWAMIPFWNDSLKVASPPDSGGLPVFDGTCFTEENIQSTKVITLLDWRDPAQSTAVQSYADDMLDAHKDTVVEGAIRYLGLFTAGLTPGLKANVTGASYTTGWESIDGTVFEAELEWPIKGPLNHITTLGVSNRKAPNTSSRFLPQERTFADPFGAGINPFAGHRSDEDVVFTAPGPGFDGLGSGPGVVPPRGAEEDRGDRERLYRGGIGEG